MGDLEDLGEEFRRMAIEAGVPAAELDGRHRCFGGCGLEVERGGAECAPCVSRRLRSEHAAGLGRAWRTVPESLGWAGFAPHPQRAGGRRLSEWVRSPSAVQKAHEWAKAPQEKAILTLTGKPGAGKTTLACAVMREMMRRGVAFEAPWAARAFARRSRFESAARIVSDRTETPLGEHVASLDLARAASLLVLDEVGRGLDTHKVIFSLLYQRHAHRQPTVITTPFRDTAELAAATGDGGLARRVFDDALVIQVGS